LQKVIFDSSFLMAVVERPTTWFEDAVDGIGKFQPVLPNCVKRELEKLASGSTKKARTARVALELAEEFVTMKCGTVAVDDEIVSMALTAKALVATADSGLALAARSAHVRTITLRSGRVAVT
jgi:rRNA-processing protein FCF1